MIITKENLDAIVADRSSIVDNYIKVTDNGLGAITAFAGMVFYEDGWDWDTYRVANSNKPQFAVTGWTPQS